MKGTLSKIIESIIGYFKAHMVIVGFLTVVIVVGCVATPIATNIMKSNKICNTDSQKTDFIDNKASDNAHSNNSDIINNESTADMTSTIGNDETLINKNNNTDKTSENDIQTSENSIETPNENDKKEISKGTVTSKLEEFMPYLSENLYKSDGAIKFASDNYYGYLFVGEKTECKVVFNYTEPVKVIKWEVEKPEVASIDQNGVLTAIGWGQTYVLATLEDGRIKKSLYWINVREYKRDFTIWENKNMKRGSPLATISDNYSIEITSLYREIIKQTGEYGSESSNKSYNYTGDEQYFPPIITNSRDEFFGYLTKKDIDYGYTLEHIQTLYSNTELYPWPDLYFYTFN